MLEVHHANTHTKDVAWPVPSLCLIKYCAPSPTCVSSIIVHQNPFELGWKGYLVSSSLCWEFIIPCQLIMTIIYVHLEVDLMTYLFFLFLEANLLFLFLEANNTLHVSQICQIVTNTLLYASLLHASRFHASHLLLVSRQQFRIYMFYHFLRMCFWMKQHLLLIQWNLTTHLLTNTLSNLQS